MAPKPPRLQRNGYLDIVEALRGRISSGEIPAGHFLGTEKELQAEHGAARSTIRKVLSELVRQGWAQSIPAKGVFAARGLTPSASTRIAFVENGTYVQSLLRRQFTPCLKNRGFVLDAVGGTHLYPFEYALQQVLDGGYAGALVWCFHAYPDPSLVDQLSRAIPIVALDHRVGKAETDLVEFDHELAAYDITTHLIQQGARRIGLTGMLDTLDSTVSRIQGYMRAMFEHDLKPDPSDFAFISTSGTEKLHSSLLEMRLRSPLRPDAYVVLHDSCAEEVVATALRCGMNLPNDLLLGAVGDDYRVTCNDLSLTAVRFHWNEMADAALTLLDERLENLHAPIRRRRVGHSLVLGGLSGASQPPSDSASPDPRPSYHFTSSWSLRKEAAAHPQTQGTQ